MSINTKAGPRKTCDKVYDQSDLGVKINGKDCNIIEKSIIFSLKTIFTVDEDFK
jgi:hypothetical protein